jgi:hypothetical protein
MSRLVTRSNCGLEPLGCDAGYGLLRQGEHTVFLECAAGGPPRYGFLYSSIDEGVLVVSRVPRLRAVESSTKFSAIVQDMVVRPNSPYSHIFFFSHRRSHTPLMGAATFPAHSQAGISTSEERPAAGRAREGQQAAMMAAAAAD